WLEDLGDGTWKMGISDYAQKMLREISYVQFEEVGEEFNANEIICVVEALKATGDIYVPFDCVLVENNRVLEDQPEIISDSPYDKGYLVRVKPKSVDKQVLISAEEYVQVIQQELDEL
nr:glycine cleavage system protein H [Candidatus Heimdallarchaeota archaeon]